MEKDWFDYIIGALGMLSSLGTFGAFIFLFRRDKDKQKQIDSLAALARATEEELMLSVRPDLYKNGATVNDGLIKIDLLNRGEQANLLEFNSTSEDVNLIDKSLPYVLEKGKERLIFVQSKQKDPIKCEYLIQTLYEDKLGNQFQLEISGVGSKVTFGAPKLNKHRYEVTH